MLWCGPGKGLMPSMNHDEFVAIFDFGSSGEKVVGSWLETKRVMHFALHPLDLLDHGPRLMANDGTTLPCPDFICWGLPPHPSTEDTPPNIRGDQFFIEVKRLRKWWDSAGEPQTGIQAERFNEYVRLAQTSEKRVYIYFLQLDELMRGDGLFFAEINTLDVAGETCPDGKKVLMFRKSDLVELATAEDLAWHSPD